MQDFTLWLEFEHVDFASSIDERGNSVSLPSWDRTNEACNVEVTLADGRRYGLTVWTYRFLLTLAAKDSLEHEHLNGLYQIPPDLFVRELTRDCIEASIADLLRRGNLEQLLNPSVVAPSLVDE